MNKTTKILAAAALLVLLLGAGIWASVLQKGKADDADAGAESSTAAETAGAQIEGIADEKWVGITLADHASSAGAGVSIEGDVVTIEKGGCYRVSGSLANGRLLVKADEDVVLRLSGVSIANTAEEVLRITGAGTVTIYLEEGTDNVLTMGTAAEITENPHKDATSESAEDSSEASENASADAALHSKTDTIICGGGFLTVNGYISNGVQVKTNLTIESGTLNVQAVNNGIKGNTAVLISGGAVAVLSGNDGIKSNGTEEGQGNVSIAGGTVNITSYGDAVQAENVLTVSQGTLKLVTKGDAVITNNTQSFQDHGWGSPDGGWDMAAETDISTKGLKAGTLIAVSGGTVDVDAADDALHSKGDVEITGGTLTLSSGDDGIHADKKINVSEGGVTITRSYEGLEASQIYIKGGDISVTASDDGMNASGGSGGGLGWGTSPASEDMANLYIQGGTLYVNAGGDGLDCNGNLYVEGGVTIVDGPSDNGNGALDSGSENGGVLRISGGTILAVGASGMAETFDSDSDQCSFKVNMSGSWQAGDTITITDAEGNVLFTHDAAKSGNSIVFSSPELTQGEEYTVTAGGQTKTVSQDRISAGDAGTGFGGGPGGPGGPGNPGDFGR